MSDNDELNHATAIAELKARVEGHAEAIDRHDTSINKLNDAVSTLREMLGGVATKNDIMDLRKDIAEKFDQRLRDAYKSIPEKVAVIFGAGMFLLALITLVVELVPRHG
jgi:predicted  nucleic acid-binding Zn-ribbon protein